MAKLTWTELNDTLRMATEADCQGLLAEEQAGENRKLWLERIHQRFNKLRRARESEALMKPTKKRRLEK